MTQDEFTKMIETYGVDPARWPADLSVQAQMFMTDNAQAAEHIMKADAALDAALNELSAPTPSDLLKKRILNTARPLAKTDVIPVRKTGTLNWRSVAALMLGTFALGFGGANLLPTNAPDIATTYAQSDTDWQSTAEDLGLSDTYAWVEGVSVDGT